MSATREKFKSAQEYAAAVRNRPIPCQCDQCRIAEMLPVVQQITRNWTAQPAVSANYK